LAEQVLVVRADEARRQLGNSQRFLGLPEEEIQRLFASIEVHAMDREGAARDPSCLQLVTYTAIHFNHLWVTCLRGPRRSMGIRAHLQADHQSHLFLDDHPKLAARREAEQAIPHQACDLRLAGLIQEEAGGDLGLVYVAKLRQAVPLTELAVPEARLGGHGDLQRERDQFEIWSQILIDNLHAL